MKPPARSSIRIIKTDKVPPGWFTRVELQKAWGISGAHTRKTIQEAINAGMAQMKIYRIETNTRGVYPIQHYKFRNKK